MTALLAVTLAMLNASATTEPARKAEPTGFLYKQLTVADQRYAYCVYVPPDYTPDRQWPLILFLHGMGERGDDGFLQTEVGIGHAIRRNHHMVPAVVVMPQCRDKDVWVREPNDLGPMAAMALACVTQTSREYNCDPRRVYLTGLSMGGMGAWYLAERYPDMWAAVVPVCGFVEHREDTGIAARLAPRLKDLPIWTFHGDQDKAVPVERSREIVAAIRAAGGTRIWYTEYPGVGHNAWDKAYFDQEMWRWLFEQRR